MTQDTDGRALTRRLNALLEEWEREVRAHGGWVTQTPTAWREDWEARKDDLLAEIGARRAADTAREGSAHTRFGGGGHGAEQIVS